MTEFDVSYLEWVFSLFRLGTRSRLVFSENMEDFPKTSISLLSVICGRKF